MILEPTASFLGTSKTMNMITIQCVSYDSEANRPLPAHFQNYENAYSLMFFL